MLFNSYTFLLLFLPVVVVVYYLLALRRNVPGKVAKWWLIAASVFFYGYWDYRYVPIILGSILVNYAVGNWLKRADAGRSRSLVLISGIIANLALLGFFKYANFFADNVQAVFGLDLGIPAIALPLAISFFTFQQIAYLVDSAGESKMEGRFTEYFLFVSFFPQLIAGPIVHHKEMMPQFEQALRSIDWNMVARGLFVLAIGLFKKVILADTFAMWVGSGYSAVDRLTLIDSWLVTLSYSLQLYFDFSGYSDMAVGCAMILGIVIPWNFKSPYKARTIQEFWRRWHITLSRFLRDYIYIPLGGSRCKESRLAFNLFITFLLGGIWHGAGWTFVLWGALHGCACVIHRWWNNRGWRLPGPLAWLALLVFINFTWVFFRAPDLATAVEMVKALVGLDGVAVPDQLRGIVPSSLTSPAEFMPGMPARNVCPLWVVGGLAIVLFAPGSYRLTESFRPSRRNCVFAAALLVLTFLNLNRISEFLYFQF